MPLLRSRFFLGAVLVLAVVACYSRVIGAGFVWDDDLLVTDNALVQGSGSLPYIWASSATTDYTPLTTTVFWLEWHLWGEAPPLFHIVNILLHCLSALLLWRVLSRLAVPGAWLGALLFAVHPVNVASVAWIAELKNALSLPFYLASISAWLRFLDARKAEPWLLALAATACALLSKGSAVILPVTLLLCACWQRRETRGVDTRPGKATAMSADLVALIPFFLLAAGAAATTIHFQSRVIDSSVAPLPYPTRIARAAEAIWFYLGKAFWPAHLSAVYSKWTIGSGILAISLLIALTVLLILRALRGHRAPLFAWACFLTALLPVLGLVDMSFLNQAYVADWWEQLALPAVTASIAALIATAWLRTRGPVRAGIATFATLLVLSLSVATWGQASEYESMETLCRATLALNPNAWAAHNNLGSVLRRQGHLDEAATEYQTALGLKPNDSSAHSNLGTIFAARHRYDEAIAQYHAALAIAPDNANVWFNLGNALHAQHRDVEALEALNHAIDSNGRWANPRYEAANILLDMGRAAEAGRQAEVLVAINPDAVSGHYVLARAAAGIGRFDVATAEATKALALAQGTGDKPTIDRIQASLETYIAEKTKISPTH